MGAVYGWATPDYLLNHMTFDQIFTYYQEAWNLADTVSTLFVNKIIIAVVGEDNIKEKIESNKNDGPDKKGWSDPEFLKRNNDKIIRPEGS